MMMPSTGGLHAGLSGRRAHRQGRGEVRGVPVKVGPTIAKHGGRYLTKGATHKMPEGGHWKPERMVIIEFPDMASLDAWYKSPEYQPLIALRKQCTSDQDMLFVLEGA